MSRASNTARSRRSRARWYHWVLVPLGGAALANGVPHFVNGMSGNSFPTPFAEPPTVGLSSPVTNAVWGLSNLAAGYWLLRFLRSRIGGTAVLPAIVLAGALGFSIFLSRTVGTQLPPIIRESRD